MFGIKLRDFIRLGSLFLMTINTALANGEISLSATRLIYDQNKKQASISIANTYQDKRYLINTWVEEEGGQKTERIIATPPLFVSEPSSENSIRVVNVTKDLPQDRETLFYLNIQAVPSLKRPDLTSSENVLQVTVLSRIKMMLRPAGLKIASSDVAQHIRAKKVDQGIRLENPTPYFVTLIDIKLDGQAQSSLMLKPFSDSLIQASGQKLSFQNIDDYGIASKQILIDVQ